jgi:FOG: Ankyrin repeat
MTNPFDIPEPKYMIINLLDLKSIARIIQVNWAFKDFIQDMPLYLELQICLNYIQHNPKVYDKKYNLREKIFISACANNCRNIINSFSKEKVTCMNISSILGRGLILACKNGHLEVAKFLVDKGAKIHADNDSALQHACSRGHLEVAKFLVDKGANIHADNDWALRHACKNGHLEVAKFLVDKGAKIHADNDWALRHACSWGHLEVAKFLVDKGANIHAYDDCALECACARGRLEVAKFLVEKGANIHACNDSPLESACENGHLEVAKYLVEKGTNFHANHGTYQYLVKYEIIKS